MVNGQLSNQVYHLGFRNISPLAQRNLGNIIRGSFAKDNAMHEGSIALIRNGRINQKVANITLKEEFCDWEASRLASRNILRRIHFKDTPFGTSSSTATFSSAEPSVMPGFPSSITFIILAKYIRFFVIWNTGNYKWTSFNLADISKRMWCCKKVVSVKMICSFFSGMWITLCESPCINNVSIIIIIIIIEFKGD